MKKYTVKTPNGYTAVIRTDKVNGFKYGGYTNDIEKAIKYTWHAEAKRAAKILDGKVIVCTN